MFIRLAICVILMIAASPVTNGQVAERELKLSEGQKIEIINRFGRVDILAKPSGETGDDEPIGLTGTLSVKSNSELTEKEIVVAATKGNLRIEVEPSSLSKRVDLSLVLPQRLKVNVETRDGEVKAEGNFAEIIALTDTGTIAVDVPTDDLTYDLWWTTSKPRFLADFDIEEVKERAGGRFQIKGRVGENAKKKKAKNSDKPEPAGEKAPTIFTKRLGDPEGNGESDKAELDKKEIEKKEAKANAKKAEEAQKAKAVALHFSTSRGIVLLNVPPNEVMSDLRERPLTNAAKAVVRSGDFVLVDAIRRASPKYFGDYAKTLPPARLVPKLTTTTREPDLAVANIKTATARVLDDKNRAIAGLTVEDFEVTESGEPREILSVKPVTAPFNLVLLLDVSGSVDTYVNFIRKAARAFVNTVDPKDRVSIVLFNDDVKVLSTFTTDKALLSETLDTFDAGGGTAYYDAIGYSLTETLRPMRGERTAIVVLTDGDDNRSFLPFDSLAGAIEESGALIYPLYVPTSLAAMGATSDLNATVDPLRAKYLSSSLTSKANGEGAKLAEISGGVYYPITQLSQIQKAYEDIVVQLRTAYDVTFRSSITSPDGKASPRLKVGSKKPGTFVQISSVKQ